MEETKTSTSKTVPNEFEKDKDDGQPHRKVELLYKNLKHFQNGYRLLLKKIVNR